MKKQSKIFKIVDLSRLNNSYYGNPAYMIEAETESGERWTGRTASNAMIAYELGSSSVGESFELFYHFTKNGNLIFDYLKKVA